MRIIFLFRSGMSSHTRKITAPSLRARAIAYLALSSLSSADFPSLTKSQLTTLGSISAHNLMSSLPSANALSLNALTGSVWLTQSSRSYSVFEPMSCKACSLTSCHTIARMNCLCPVAMSFAPIPSIYTLSFLAASIATWQLVILLKTLFGVFSIRFHSTTLSLILWMTLHKTIPSFKSWYKLSTKTPSMPRELIH